MSGGKNAPGELPPEFIDSYVRTNQFADKIGDGEFQDYTGPGVVGLDPMQDRAAKLVSNLAENRVGLDPINAGIKFTQEAARYTPDDIKQRDYNAANVKDVKFQDAAQAEGDTARATSMDAAQVGKFDGAKIAEMQAAQIAPWDGAKAAEVSDFERARAAEAEAAKIQRGKIGDVASQSIADTNLGQYQNKYQNQVIDRGLADMEQARQRQKEVDKAEAIAAGAFGGSREGVQRALTNESFQKQNADFIAQQRAQGFDNASRLATSDADRAMQAALANQGADLNVYGQNAGFEQQAALQNANLKTNTNQFNSSGAADQGLAAAQLAQNNRQFNATGQAQVASQQAGFNQQAAMSNQQAQNAGAQFNATGAQNNQLAQAGYNQNANQYNAQAANNNSQFNAQQNQQNAQFNATQQNNVVGQANNYGMQQALTQAQLEQQSRSEGAANKLAADQSNQQAGLTGNAQTLAAGQQMANLGQAKQDLMFGTADKLNQYGAQAQQNAQQQEGFNYQEFLREQQDPYQRLGALTSATGSMTAPASGQSTKGQAMGNMATKASDERLKTNIETIGTDARGRRIISWEYLSDLGRRVTGYSAQDLLKSDPHAVRLHPFGFLMVDYSALEAA